MHRFAAANLTSKASWTRSKRQQLISAKRDFGNAALNSTTRGGGIISSSISEEHLLAKVSSRLGWTRKYDTHHENNYKAAAVDGGTYNSTLHMNSESERQKDNFHASLGEEMCLLEDPLILILQNKLLSEHAVMKVLMFGYEVQKPLLIVAEDLGTKAYWTVRMKTKQHPLSICATIKAHEFGEDRISILQDLAKLTGGQIITEELGIGFDPNDLCMKVLGSCKRVLVHKEAESGHNVHKSTILIEGGCRQSTIPLSTMNYEKDKLPEKLAIRSASVYYPALGNYTAEDIKYMNGSKSLAELPCLSEEFATQTCQNVQERYVASIADRAKFCKSNGECNCDIEDYYFENDTYRYNVQSHNTY